ncbi:host attachment protein [Patescibacteria group bacterium]|nr:host attachment protein [Patescibacteria group bacterium]
MKITNKLPQFESKSVLLVTTGGSVSVFFIAKNGFLKEVSRVEEGTSHYSDREGFFQRSGSGKVFGSGSVYEENNVEREKRFVKKVVDEILKIDQKSVLDEIYLYSPRYISKRIQSDLPKILKDKITETFDHNYVNEHPITLLEKIKSKHDEIFGKSVPIKKEARKILNKFKLAGR